MDLTPGEKAVLGQIRVLYSAAGRDQQTKVLVMQWPSLHHETYEKAYGGLLAKRLIQESGAQMFRITDAGLKAIGVAVAEPQPRPQPQVRRADERTSVKQVGFNDAGKRRRNVFSRLVNGLLHPRT